MRFLLRFLFPFALLPGLGAGELPSNLQREKLVAWCIVPFDAAQRSPVQRAKMLAELGIKRCAYDWRDEHVATFEEEILAYQKHGIEYFAFWGEHPEAFRLFKKHHLHPQIWKMFPEPAGTGDEEKVERAAKSLEPLAKQTATLNCKLSLYNHGGWSGEPANLVAVCQRLHQLGYPHVGIVYNWHHGHEVIEDWPDTLALLKPYLHCLNINGMKRGPEAKILPLGEGDFELGMLQTLIKSGYAGPIGILDHRMEVDSKKALQANLDGLAKMQEQLRSETAE